MRRLGKRPHLFNLPDQKSQLVWIYVTCLVNCSQIPRPKGIFKKWSFTKHHSDRWTCGYLRATLFFCFFLLKSTPHPLSIIGDLLQGRIFQQTQANQDNRGGQSGVNTSYWFDMKPQTRLSHYTAFIRHHNCSQVESLNKQHIIKHPSNKYFYVPQQFYSTLKHHQTRYLEDQVQTFPVCVLSTVVLQK